ncbi:MAG TPA: zf-HC2 domain-containing protein, partial [Byssovorax sp.]
MDCEKFDLHVMDALYDELDELTYAALRRHVEGCSRCGAVWSELRATREVGVLPIVQPSDDLEARVLEAALAAQKTTPFPRKVLRALSWAGSHAMRPQLAMAALFFLVIGSSLLLLRARPGTPGAPMRVTERGAPAPDEEPPAATAAPAPAPASPGVAQRAEESEAKQKDAPKERERDKDAATDAKAALADARATRDKSGCGAAVGKFDEVGGRFPATAAAADAMWEEAVCYRSLGEPTKARELLLALKANGAYRDRVEQELSAEPQMNGNAQNVVATRAPAHAAPPAAQAAAAPLASAAPSATPNAAAEATSGSAYRHGAAAPRAKAAKAPATEPP